jgi:hypothetical protein
VIHDARELGEDGARPHRPGWGFDPQHLLDGAAIGDVVDKRGAVVEPVGIGDHLLVGVGLGHLLEAAMEIADLHLTGIDGLAIERRHHPQRAMHRRVGRPDVDGHPLEEVLLLFDRRLRMRAVDLVLGQHPASGRVVVLAQRMPLKTFVGQNPAQVWVTFETEAK